MPTARVTMNFHTDIPKIVHDLLLLKGYYKDAVEDWAPILDVTSFDAYPNDLYPTPVNGEVVGQRTAEIVEAHREAGVPCQPIFVMETGYFVANAAVTNGTFQLYSQENQALYFEQAYNSTMRAGGSGLMVFEVTDTPGITPPPGGYTAEDVLALNHIYDFLHGEDILGALGWAISSAGRSWIKTRASVVYSSVFSDGFGILTETGDKRQAWYALAKLWAEN